MRPTLGTRKAVLPSGHADVVVEVLVFYAYCQADFHDKCPDLSHSVAGAYPGGCDRTPPGCSRTSLEPIAPEGRMREWTTDPEALPPVGSILRPPGVTDLAGQVLEWGVGRGPRVLISTHGLACEPCRNWLHRALAREEEILSWGGRIVVPEAEEGVDVRTSGWVAVADEWGEVFHAAAIGPDHVFPDTSDLATWVRFVAIQCPECEGPEGPWLP